MNEPGVFSVSLDFELHWGCFENIRKIDDKAELYFSNTKASIPKMLSLFEKGGIHVTWAIVGMLFCHDTNEWEENKPSILPSFTNKSASAYDWVDTFGFKSEDDQQHFAPELIELINKTPFQEIGTHTYAHYFCLEPGQTIEQFREDIRIACKLAAKKGLKLRSLVFPRNQYNESYLSVCNEFGITAVRTSPEIWYWAYSDKAGSFMKRFFRAGDAYLKFQPIKTQYLKDISTDQLPLKLPSTRLYRAWRPKFSIENKLKLRRILNEMTNAAKKGAYYHIWWHPHNFGYHPDECLIELETIINHFNILKNKYGFRSLNMSEITDLLLKK
jgi:peptidoglycan/xylan/chitin deacetylase (PgdA/CDA1 family)